jgi:hypothetical protein
MRRLAALLALVLLCAGAPAFAQPLTPEGEFRGVVHVRQRSYDVGLKVRRTAEGYAATYDWIDLELRDIPMARVLAGPAPVFERKSPQGTFVAWYSPEAGWRGEWRRWGQAFPTTFRPAALPPAPLLPRGDRRVLILLGGLIVLQGAGIARLLQIRRRRRRRRRAGA